MFSLIPAASVIAAARIAHSLGSVANSDKTDAQATITHFVTTTIGFAVLLWWLMRRSVLPSRWLTRSACNDTWRFDFTERAWRKVDCAASAALPPPRLLGATEIVDGHLWLLGGWNGGLTGLIGTMLSFARGVPKEYMFGDIWRLALSKGCWEQVQLAEGSASLGGVSRFATAAIGSTIWIFTHRCNDGDPHIFALDTNKCLLRKLTTSGPAPPGRRGLASLTAVGKTLHLLGGAPKEGQFFDDHFILDTESLRWEKVETEGPGPIAAHSVCEHNGRLYLWGGSRKIVGHEHERMVEYHPGLLVFDCEAKKWGRPGTTGSGPPNVTTKNDSWTKGDVAPGRTGQTMRRVGDDLVLYGGWLPFKETFGDTYALAVGNGPQELCWKQAVEDGASLMPPRSGHMAASDTESAYVFGGYCENKNNCWAWDTYGLQSDLGARQGCACYSPGTEHFEWYYPHLAALLSAASLGVVAYTTHEEARKNGYAAFLLTLCSCPTLALLLTAGGCYLRRPKALATAVALSLWPVGHRVGAFVHALAVMNLGDGWAWLPLDLDLTFLWLLPACLLVLHGEKLAKGAYFHHSMAVAVVAAITRAMIVPDKDSSSGTKLANPNWAYGLRNDLPLPFANVLDSFATDGSVGLYIIYMMWVFLMATITTLPCYYFFSKLNSFSGGGQWGIARAPCY